MVRVVRVKEINLHYAQGMDSETMITIFICCHLIGMASTVFNPVMYGYRNEHLRHDALQVGIAKGSLIPVPSSLSSSE